MSVAVASLHRHVSEYPRDASAHHLRQSIADFEAQIASMDARLQDLTPERS
jgi:hypothetical protein